tara:strand:+ start:2314 stop:2772 length:459 start_codon:yes stop_codon:yes gene_type:complete
MTPELNKEQSTPEKSDQATTKAVEKSSNDLFAHLGIDASQVDTTKQTNTKVKELLTNADNLKANMKTATDETNRKTGKNIVFTGIQRKGYLKDNDGKFVMKDGKKVERYVQVKQNGFWTLDKTPDGKYWVASKVHYYTESFTIADYTEIKDS